MYPLVVNISESLPNPGPYWSLCLADAVQKKCQDNLVSKN